MSFAHRKSVEQVETGLELAPKFDEDGADPGCHHRSRERRSVDARLHEPRSSDQDS